MSHEDERTKQSPLVADMRTGLPQADAPRFESVEAKEDLRQQAEKLFRERMDRAHEELKALSLEEAQLLLHELQVHQIELEIQNEELWRAQVELDTARERYFELYDLAPVGYVVVNNLGLILNANFAAATLLRCSPGSLAKQPFSRFIFKADQDVYFLFRKQLLVFERNSQACELRMVTQDNTTIWVQLSTTVVQDKDDVPVFRIVLIDITERKRAEEERDKLESQLIQIKKMESIGRLAGGVAHEYNNMLAIIMGYTQIALDETDPASSLHQDLLQVQVAGQRSVDITRQLLSFARKQTVAPKILNLNAIIEIGILQMLRQLIGENIDLAWKPKANLLTVKIDASQVDQILINLCVNARDAISGTGKITVTTDKAILDGMYCANHPGATPGEYVLLTVRDDGSGIDKDILDNIFEPFFTTKELGQGTGLGLSTVFGIVKQNNGYINVDSIQGVGTTFSIYLPRYGDPADQARKGVQAVPVASRGIETILLVEDELMILNMATIMLRTKGYTVLSATTPNEAFELAEQHTGEIHLLVTDVLLPEMNGRELANRLNSLYPDMKLLFMSGYTADIIAREGVLEESCNFIEKPFSSLDLTSKIREILDQ